MTNSALYYPYIDITSRNASQIKAMALFYDKIYRIVPDSIIPNDCIELKELLTETSIVKKLNPVKYALEASKQFMEAKDNWNAAALASSQEEDANFARLHTDKIDKVVRNLFNELGYKANENWINVPTDLVSNYMLFLAKEMAKKNNLQLVADSWAPWTATTYFNLNGSFGDYPMPYGDSYDEDPFALYSLIISEMVPINIAEIPADKIIIFREKRADEIENLRKAIFEIYGELQKIEDPSIRKYIIKDKVNKFKKAIEEYKKSADIIKAKGWFGILLMGFTAPITLGNYFKIPSASSVILAATELAIGGIVNIKNTQSELKKLQKENPISCLMEMRNDFRNYPTWRESKSRVDMNNHAYNCIEEYIND